VTPRERELLARAERAEKEVAEFKRAFDQLTPQGQAEAMPFMKILGIVMYMSGIVDFTVTLEEIAAIPEDRCVVLGEVPRREDRLRVRWMTMEQANSLPREGR